MNRPERSEAAAYYFKYIDRVPAGDIVGVLQTQLEQVIPFLSAISEETSRHRYAPDKWSVRQVLNHVTDCERLFLFRAFWFARRFDTPLPSFDQDVASAAAGADDVAWSAHLEELRLARLASLAFFRNLPADAWERTGVASDNPFSVRALAFIAAGHLDHHLAILRERYLG
jgi:hypothetical protein